MPGGLYPPPSVIASWPKPNYINPVTQGPALTYLCIVFASLSLATVTVRTYSRIFITKAPGIDDLLVAVAAGFSIALSVLLIFQEKTWLVGRHIWDIPVDKFAGQRRNIYICEWCYLTATCSVKISILLFYRRLSVTFSKSFLVATWVGILFNVLYFMTFIICLLALFRPLDSYWLSFDPQWAATHKFSHGDEAWSLPTSAALSVIGDFYSTLLPLLLIRFLDLPQQQKAALYGLFGLGFLVVAAGVVRTILLDRVIAQTYDVSWVLWENWIWTVIELNLAILAASAPALKPFFRRFLIDPIVTSHKQGSYVYDSRRRSPVTKRRSAQRFGWNNNTTTQRESNNPDDLEKTSIALTQPLSKAEMIEEEIDDGVSTRRYQLRTSRDGKMVPVQVQEQTDFDARSWHTADSSAHILPGSKSGDCDASADLRHYCAQIEGLPPILRSQPQTRPRNQSSDMQREPGPLARNPSQSNTMSRSKPGSVSAAHARAQDLQDLERGLAHMRSLSRGSERNFSLPHSAVVGSSPYQHLERGGIDAFLNGRSSSEETQHMPRQGSCGEYRPSGVGYAV